LCYRNYHHNHRAAFDKATGTSLIMNNGIKDAIAADKRKSQILFLNPFNHKLYGMMTNPGL
jgi:hypothetical protein